MSHWGQKSIGPAKVLSCGPSLLLQPCFALSVRVQQWKFIIPFSNSNSKLQLFTLSVAVVGIPTSLSRLRLAVSAANRSPPSRSAPPRQPSRPSHKVSYSLPGSVVSARNLTAAIIRVFPCAFSRNCRANRYLFPVGRARPRIARRVRFPKGREPPQGAVTSEHALPNLSRLIPRTTPAKRGLRRRLGPHESTFAGPMDF